MNLPLPNPDVNAEPCRVDAQPRHEVGKIGAGGEFDAEAELELMREVGQGGERALERLIAGHQADVRRMVGRLTAWGNDVDDLTQEVFLKAWKRAGSFDGTGALRSWLLAIAVRQCRNHHRSATRLLNALTRLAQRTPSTITAVVRSDNDAVMDERWVEVQRALAGLASRDRELLVLIVMEQQPVEEVAAMLNISTNTLYVRLHRAKGRLIKLLQHNSQFEQLDKR